MIASFQMYRRPQNAVAHDRLWALIRDRLRAAGIAAPQALDSDLAHDAAWARDDLCLSQICNLPWRARFRDRVTLIAACDYGVAGDAPGYYHSVFVVRADDPATDLAQASAYAMAYNEALSNSGWGVPVQFAQAQGLRLRPALHTGAHAASARAVAEGRAGLAALDAISWRQMQRWDGFASALRVIGRTHATPGMSFVTRAGQDPAPYAAAIAQAIAAMAGDDRDLLGLRGIVALPDSAYDIPLPPDPQAFAA